MFKRASVPPLPDEEICETLVITEKPDVGVHIAKAIGDPQPNDGFIVTANRTVVVFMYGFLLEPKKPEEYDPSLKEFLWETTPFIPKPFQMKPKDGLAAKQLRVLGRFFKVAKRVIIATDADRSGEAIAYEGINLFRFAGLIERLWLSDLSIPAIRLALKNLRHPDETIGLCFAEIARIQADWYVGMGMSRAAALALRERGNSEPISVGRVQTPALALVVMREEQIRAFVPEHYFELEGIAQTAGGQRFQVALAPDAPARIRERHIADRLAKVALGAVGRLRVKDGEAFVPPPPLFSASLLQLEANRRFGWTTEKTMKVAQRIYELGFITYPRPNNSYLPAAQQDQIREKISNLAAIPDLAHLAAAGAQVTIRRDVYDDAGVKGHHAIVPTLSVPDPHQMGPDGFQLFTMIAERTVAAHMPDAVFATRSILFDAGGVPFTLRASIRDKAGWQAVERTADPNGRLPDVRDGEVARMISLDVVERHTSPPDHYTEGTLVADMENIGATVQDPRHRRVLEQSSGIGTGGTRPIIIKSLKDRGFLLEQGIYVVPSELGGNVVRTLRRLAPTYVDPVMTALWEDKLELIAQRKFSVTSFLSMVENQIRRDVAQIRAGVGVDNMAGSSNRKGQSRPGQLPKDVYLQRKKEALESGIPLAVYGREDRDRAAALGAIWIGEKNAWMITPTMDPKPFRDAGFLR